MITTYSHILNAAAIIAMSNIIDNAKVGMVIFVGSAARLVTSVIAIAAMAKEKRTGLFPVDITTNNVSGVMKHACVVSAIPNHRNLLSSWFLHHVMNLVHVESFETSCV